MLPVVICFLPGYTGRKPAENLFLKGLNRIGGREYRKQQEKRA